MALIACAECNAQISTKAKACPGCGARPPKSRAALYLLLCIPVIVIALVAMRTPSPEEVAQREAGLAIDLCWEDQKTKSYEPSKARFVAGVCEKMENDYRAKYGHNP